jgi:hypothetical protein
VEKQYPAGPHGIADKDVDRVRQVFMQSLKKLISQASADLQMSQMTVRRILRKNLCLKPYKVQVIQIGTAHDKWNRSQYVAHMCKKVLEHDNFLSHVICKSEPPREHLGHEQDSLKVNVFCTLTHERVIGPFFFDENTIIGSSFLNRLECYSLPHLNKIILFLNWMVHLFILLTL